MPDDRRVLEGVGHLIVDGANVLHALSRSPGPVPPAALIGRLRAIVPAGVGITVVLDGSPEHGLHVRQVASGVEVRYSGRETADEMIARLIEQAGDAEGVLVVSDDIELGNAIRRAGGRTARTNWLLNRLDRQRLAAPAPGRKGLAPSAHGGAPSSETSDDEDAKRWQPGRGATRKRGNPHRGHREPG
jgi:hypothetical protein